MPSSARGIDGEPRRSWSVRRGVLSPSLRLQWPSITAHWPLFSHHLPLATRHLAARAAIRPQRVLEEPAAEREQGLSGNDDQNDHVGSSTRTITLDGTRTGSARVVRGRAGSSSRRSGRGASACYPRPREPPVPPSRHRGCRCLAADRVEQGPATGASQAIPGRGAGRIACELGSMTTSC